ncbi:hypothetical protein HPB51_013021 [Rhipicephalus microplus]|uniref:Histone PARylation factor 1 n=1 Tax=Rhipicephalus microplus TaxID=6941 RepID=A0A9J6F2J1_RHIMP|nr:hypothetical protein HPB51_013021 [Rhipicephalus microplus]
MSEGSTDGRTHLLPVHLDVSHVIFENSRDVNLRKLVLAKHDEKAAPVDDKVPEKPTGEDSSLPDSPGDVRESIKQKFLVEMPEDFYDFWDFCCSLKKESPSDALYELLHLRLVGPFDVLAGKLTNKKASMSDDFLCHWRYFYDPPEMQTVLSGDDETMYHIGYFRDDPEEMPVFLASNVASEGCKIVKVAGNLFAVLR